MKKQKSLWWPCVSVFVVIFLIFGILIFIDGAAIGSTEILIFLLIEFVAVIVTYRVARKRRTTQVRT